MVVEAIIPAFNEERTIGSVLKAVKQVNLIDKIYVVSDGSTDNTALIASSMGAEVIELQQNVGKGGAIKAGLKKCDCEIIVFLDADLIGLRKEHILSLVKPVLTDAADMSIGIFNNGRLTTDLAHRIAPYLSGQRAVKKRIIDEIPDMDISRYGVEAAVTLYFKKCCARIMTIQLQGLTHIMKEEKLGFLRGFGARMRMYWDILKVLWI